MCADLRDDSHTESHMEEDAKPQAVHSNPQCCFDPFLVYIYVCVSVFNNNNELLFYSCANRPCIKFITYSFDMCTQIGNILFFYAIT